MTGIPLPTPTTLADNHTAAVVLMASNASGYQEDHDHHDLTITAGLTEKQRIVLACVTALLLAVCAIIIGFVLRRLMKKTSSGGVYTVEANFPLWRKRSDANSDDACAINQQRAASAATAAQLKDPATHQSYGFDDQVGSGWTTCSQGMTSPGGGVMTSSNGGGMSVTSSNGGAMTSSNSGHCVITMTMRNNHLIVETEEEQPPPQCELVETTTTTDPSTTTTTAVCDVTTQPVVVHQDAAAPLAVTAAAVASPSAASRPRHPSVSTAVAGTGLSQADGESDGCSPRHPYTYGGGQSEYGWQEKETTRTASARRPATHSKAYFKFQTQVSQDVIGAGDTAVLAAAPATATGESEPPATAT